MTKFIYQFTKSTAVSHCLRYFPKIASEVPLGVHQSTGTHPYTSHSSSPMHGRHCWQLPQSWCIQGHTPGCRTLVYRGTLPHTLHCPLQPHRSCCRSSHPSHTQENRFQSRSCQDLENEKKKKILFLVEIEHLHEYLENIRKNMFLRAS